MKIYFLAIVLVLVIAALFAPAASAAPAQATTASGYAYRTLNSAGNVTGRAVLVSNVTVVLHNRTLAIYKITSGAYAGYYMKSPRMSNLSVAGAPKATSTPTNGYSVPVNVNLFWQIVGPR